MWDSNVVELIVISLGVGRGCEDFALEEFVKGGSIKVVVPRGGGSFVNKT